MANRGVPHRFPHRIARNSTGHRAYTLWYRSRRAARGVRDPPLLPLAGVLSPALRARCHSGASYCCDCCWHPSKLALRVFSARMRPRRQPQVSPRNSLEQPESTRRWFALRSEWQARSARPFSAGPSRASVLHPKPRRPWPRRHPPRFWEARCCSAAQRQRLRCTAAPRCGPSPTRRSRRP